MILINFAHPLTPEQIGQITVQLGRAPMRIVAAPSQFDVQQPLGPQIADGFDDAVGVLVKLEAQPETTADDAHAQAPLRTLRKHRCCQQARRRGGAEGRKELAAAAVG